MTTEEYLNKLKTHDWYFQYSDDHGVWGRGKAERKELWDLAQENEEFMEMFIKHRDKMFQD